MRNLLDPDATLFGIRLWRKRLSDAEYVERVRKLLGINRWLRYLNGLAAIGGVVIGLILLEAALDLLVNPPVPAWQQNLAFGFFAGAVLAGFFVGNVFGVAMHWAMQMFVEDRSGRLLVECWDALGEMLTTREDDHLH